MLPMTHDNQRNLDGHLWDDDRAFLLPYRNICIIIVLYPLFKVGHCWIWIWSNQTHIKSIIVDTDTHMKKQIMYPPWEEKSLEQTERNRNGTDGRADREKRGRSLEIGGFTSMFSSPRGSRDLILTHILTTHSPKWNKRRERERERERERGRAIWM